MKLKEHWKECKVDYEKMFLAGLIPLMYELNPMKELEDIGLPKFKTRGVCTTCGKPRDNKTKWCNSCTEKYNRKKGKHEEAKEVKAEKVEKKSGEKNGR